MTCVARGAGMILEDLDTFSRYLVGLSGTETGGADPLRLAENNRLVPPAGRKGIFNLRI